MSIEHADSDEPTGYDYDGEPTYPWGELDDREVLLLARLRFHGHARAADDLDRLTGSLTSHLELLPMADEVLELLGELVARARRRRTALD